ncbi:MAG: cytochrome-c peroxidase, partial [Myxococcales bacterium]
HTSTVVLLPLLLLACTRGPAWTPDEIAVLHDLRLTGAAVPPDPSNRYADDEAAARLGQRFFFDTRFSSNGAVSCATCHVPEKGFQDGLPLARGVGTTSRRTQPLAGTAASSWLFWDGRKDSLWSQALGPLESEVEHGGDRVQYVQLIAREYPDEYTRVFGSLPDFSSLPAHAAPNGSVELRDAWQRIPPAQQAAVNRVFANLGKAIAAYERKLQPGPTRFDRYVDAVADGDEETADSLLTEDEQAGLRLFIGKANCVECHNGPLLTNHDFANIGVPGTPGDKGRLSGAAEVLQDEFNCLGPYSDAPPESCRELRAMNVDARALRQFKVPSLRNVAERAPFMHAGQFATLEQVIDHYNEAPRATAGETELKPLNLTAREKHQLILFLSTLSGPLDTADEWLQPPQDAR